MNKRPKNIKLNQIAQVIYDKFKNHEYINCYISSNAAAPTASIEAFTESIKNGSMELPFIKMIHLLLQGNVPYVAEGFQDKIKAYSIFSAGDVRKAANEGRAYYLPCSLAHIDSLVGKGKYYQPDVAIIKVSQNKYTGEYSLGLSVEAIHTAIDHAQIVIAELDETMPFTQGQSVVDASSIDYLIKDDIQGVYTMEAPDFDNLAPEEFRIGELITQYFIEDGATIQVGIGKIPDAVIGTLKKSDYKNLGIQTELYGDGLMQLQKMGIVTNREKKINHGYSTTSLIMGSQELYDYVHMRTGVQMRPISYTNSAHTIQGNSPFISVNTAMGIDLFGNVWADFVDSKRYYSGVGGQPDFIRALKDKSHGTPIIAMKSVIKKGESKITPAHPQGLALTASSFDSVVLVTEYGIADLRELTSGLKALAIASVSHPKYRDAYLRQLYNDPMFTKPVGYTLDKVPRGVTLYSGDIKI
ncbi:MAG: hypothetical protein K8R67_08470 [Desulfobacteraceae bacterium]|nr:hypothetical protein [Desulfobacteraceae bacterium]